MPAKTFGILLGLMGVLTVAIYLLLRRDPRTAARQGSGVKRRLLTTGLAVLAMLGIGSTPGCEQRSGPRAKHQVDRGVKPDVEAPPPASARAEMNLDGTRFGPHELDTNNQPVKSEYSSTTRKPVTTKTIFEDLKNPKKVKRERPVTCYIVRFPLGQPSLMTPQQILGRMLLIQKFMATNALSTKTLEKIWLRIENQVDKLEREHGARNRGTE